MSATPLHRSPGSGSGSHSTPRPGAVLREQVRAVGLALRRPAAAAAALALLATLFLATEILSGGHVIDFRPEHWILPGVVGLLLPIGVWTGEDRFGAGFLWTLPVDRRRHALIKVLAGWAWLMAGVGVFVLWLLVLALLSGGNITGEETLRFIPSSAIPMAGSPDLAAVQTVRWTPDPLIWLVPFTAATAMYLIASAVVLGATVRSVILTGFGVFLLMFVVSTAGGAVNSEWLTFGPSRWVQALLYGPYGLSSLLTAGTDFVGVSTTLSSGETVMIRRGVPDRARWAAATLLWTAAGLLALWAAASRHRETRRN